MIRTAAFIVTVGCACLLAQLAPKPAKSTAGSGVTHDNLRGGMIYGDDWIIIFNNMPWMPDTDVANDMGLQEVFHPKKWNIELMSPSITVSFSEKTPGVTLESEVSRDVKSTAKQFPSGLIEVAPDMVIGKTKAPVRIFKYKQGWDMTVYSNGGPLSRGAVVFLSTLHCQTEKECAPFIPMFRNFIPTLDYIGHVRITKTRPQNATPPKP
jgi:hypothetical protein